MTNIYLVKFIETEKIFSYTSLDAMFTAHSRKEIGVSKEYLYIVFSDKPFYKGKRVLINKIPAFNKSDVEGNLHKSIVIYC